MGKRRKRSAIQNEDTLIEALYGETLFISCKNKKDAHSKCVSLNNARSSRLSIEQQKKIRIQETFFEGEWGVKVFPATEIPIYKIVDGKKILWNPEDSRAPLTLVNNNKSKLSNDNYHILELMLKDKVSTEEILSTLLNEKPEDIMEAINILSKEVEVS
jgi:hypothetical protein